MKRLSDKFEEEAEEWEEKLLAQGFSPIEAHRRAWENPEFHTFLVPPEARWDQILKNMDRIGEAINEALKAVEEANLQLLKNVLTRVDFADSNRISQDTLRRLVKHFSSCRLKDRDFAEPDLMGRAYEYLLKQFAEEAGRRGGEFYTPREVVRLMVEILKPEEGMSICDPTVGTGGMLLECAAYVKRRGGNSENLILHGQEKNPDVWAMCKMNMLLHGLFHARIELGDIIREPKLVDNGKLITYDRVIANPPFSLKAWGEEFARRDPYRRFRYGIPPRNFGDFAFIEHMIAILKPKGKMAVVAPHGVLFRGGSEEEIRKGIVEDDIIEAIIGLPPNIFYYTGIPSCVIVINKAKSENRQGKILFIDASRDYLEGRNQNFLREEDIRKIIETYEAFEDVPGYAKVVSLKEIKENNFNLSISRYVYPLTEEETIDLNEVMKEIRSLEAEREKLRFKLEQIFPSLIENKDEPEKKEKGGTSQLFLFDGK